MDFLVNWISNVPGFAVPFALAALGLILTEKSGVLSLGRGETGDHCGLGLRRHIATGVLQERDKIIAGLTHLPQLEIQHTDPRDARPVGKPKQVLSVIIA